MLLTYTRTNPVPLAEFGNLTAGNPPFVGQAVTRPPACAIRAASAAAVSAISAAAGADGAGADRGQSAVLWTSGDAAAAGGVGVRSPRPRRYRQTSPEWAMLDETRPTIPAALLTPTSVPPRLTGERARSFRRPNLPPDAVATVGPGLSARPPFVGTAAGPRFTQRDFLVQARRYRQPDPRAALSGLTARTIGSFSGAKLGFLNVQQHAR